MRVAIAQAAIELGNIVTIVWFDLHFMFKDIEGIGGIVTHVEQIFRRFFDIRLVVAPEEGAGAQDEVHVLNLQLKRTRPEGQYTERDANLLYQASLEGDGNAHGVDQSVGHVLPDVEVLELDGALEEAHAELGLVEVVQVGIQVLLHVLVDFSLQHFENLMFIINIVII